MTDDLHDRVAELERRAAHYERMAEDLSAVLIAQTATIERLGAQVLRLCRRLDEVEGGWERSPQDDAPPPHY